MLANKNGRRRLLEQRTSPHADPAVPALHPSEHKPAQQMNSIDHTDASGMSGGARQSTGAILLLLLMLLRPATSVLYIVQLPTPHRTHWIPLIFFKRFL